MKMDYNIEDLDSLNNGQLKRIADYWLRQYLLANTPQKFGKYLCPIKKKYYSPNNMHVAHFIDRGVYHLRWDLRNVRLISASSNMYDAQIPVEGHKSKHHKEYAELLENEGFLEQLLQDKNKREVLTKSKLIKTINFLRDGTK